MAERIDTDFTVVGSGIAGLWVAKNLVDEGYDVAIVERSDTLTDGATTRNEGWLHAGTYHSVAIKDYVEARHVVTSTRMGHEAIVSFAPESIDHAATFAVTGSDEVSQQATNSWVQSGVPFTEVNPKIAALEGLNTQAINGLFRVEDKSINSRVLCEKLVGHILERGGRFFTGATFTPEDETMATIEQDGKRFSVHSQKYFVTAGSGAQKIVENLTGEPFAMRYFKAHLVVMPRLTENNFFCIENGEAGFMNHNQGSVIGINRDGIELDNPNYDVDPGKQRLIMNAACRLVPHAIQYGHKDIATVVCNKPDVTGAIGEVQNLDVQAFEPGPNYVVAFPGKMTMAPYLAGRLTSDITGPSLQSVPMQVRRNLESASPTVTPRPLDVWADRYKV